MSKARKNRSASDSPQWLQADIVSSELAYHFGITQPKDIERFHDILTLECVAVVRWPEEWTGVEVQCLLSADRKIETAMRLGKPPPGQPMTNDYFRDDPTQIGYIHRVPAKGRPKHLVFEARLPKDMLMETAHLIRLEVWRALSIYFYQKPPPADPRARWIRTIEFQAEVDS